MKRVLLFLWMSFAALKADFVPSIPADSKETVSHFFDEKFQSLGESATAVCLSAENFPSLISISREDGFINVSSYVQILAIKNWETFANEVVQLPQFPFVSNQKDLKPILNLSPLKIISLQSDRNLPISMRTIASQQIDSKKYSRVASKMTLSFSDKDKAKEYVLSPYEFYRLLPIAQKLVLTTQKRSNLTYWN